MANQQELMSDRTGVRVVGEETFSGSGAHWGHPRPCCCVSSHLGPALAQPSLGDAHQGCAGAGTEGGAQDQY